MPHNRETLMTYSLISVVNEDAVAVDDRAEEVGWMKSLPPLTSKMTQNTK